MKQLLTWIGISRQAVYQNGQRIRQSSIDKQRTLELADIIRQKHPGMSCRDVYRCKASEMPRGRDWTEMTMLSSGYGIKRRRSFTQAGSDFVANLIEGMSIKKPNQIWQTDITYVWVSGRWWYVSFIIDVFTRQVLASRCSKDLSSRSQRLCLQKAIKKVGLSNIKGLIVHTDRGVQYTCEEYKKWLSKRGIRQSMARYAYENAYCERLHRTIKYNYLKYYKLDSFTALQAGVKKAVRLYNTEKPHRSLPNQSSPQRFASEYAQGKHPEFNFKIWSRLTYVKSLNVN